MSGFSKFIIFTSISFSLFFAYCTEYNPELLEKVFRVIEGGF